MSNSPLDVRLLAQEEIGRSVIDVIIVIILEVTPGISDKKKKSGTER